MRGQQPVQFSVEFTHKGIIWACRWRWPTASEELWHMSHTNGDRWANESHSLSEEGRTELLDRFGLSSVADEFLLGDLQKISPAALMERRRKLEQDNRFSPLEVVSDLSTKVHVDADWAA